MALDDPTPATVAPRERTIERRRRGWQEFRHAYPGLITTMFVALVIMLIASGWLIARRARYQSEIARLRSGMSAAERARADILEQSEENKFQVMIALLRRQAQGDKTLHLSVALDSGVMYFEREGALLREMPMQVGPEKLVGEPPDTVRLAPPRGVRTVERVLKVKDAWEVPRWVYSDRGLDAPGARNVRGALGPVALVLAGGTVIYSMPTSGPLNDSVYVLPGSVRARASDLQAIVPNITRGMKVYFY